MDWKMPEVDGLEISKTIKSHPELSEIPAILMVSAHGDEQVKSEAEEIGLAGYLSKPVKPSLLFNSILEIFGKQIAEKHSEAKIAAPEVKGLEQIQGAKILLVEDNLNNQEVGTQFLKRAGFWVQVANNGQQAVEMVESELYKAVNEYSGAYDAVLMDVQMPVMDGYAATRELRKLSDSGIKSSNKQGPRKINYLPIIAMTAHAMEGDREKCLQAGMDDYIAKPINPKELYTTLVRWIEPGKRKKPDYEQENAAQDAQESGLPEHIPGLKLQDSLDRLGRDYALYKRLLSRFYQENQNIIEQLRLGLKNDDLNKAASLLHTFKGSAGNIGAHKLANAVALLEEALKQSDLQKAYDLLENVSQETDTILRALKPVVVSEEDKDAADNADSTGNEVTDTDTDKEQITQLISELEDLLEMDITQAEDKMKELADLIGRTTELEQMEQGLQSYDTEAMLQALSKLAGRLKFDKG
jgi:CheY-like chemotaxis protein